MVNYDFGCFAPYDLKFAATFLQGILLIFFYLKMAVNFKSHDVKHTKLSYWKQSVTRIWIYQIFLCVSIVLFLNFRICKKLSFNHWLLWGFMNDNTSRFTSKGKSRSMEISGKFKSLVQRLKKFWFRKNITSSLNSHAIFSLQWIEIQTTMSCLISFEMQKMAILY